MEPETREKPEARRPNFDRIAEAGEQILDILNTPMRGVAGEDYKLQQNTISIGNIKYTIQFVTPKDTEKSFMRQIIASEPANQIVIRIYPSTYSYSVEGKRIDTDSDPEMHERVSEAVANIEKKLEGWVAEHETRTAAELEAERENYREALKAFL